MIVLDASVVVELLTGGPMAETVGNALAGRKEPFIVPHILDVEVLCAVRKLTAGHRLEADRAAQILISLAALPAERYPHTPLLVRMWELRHNFTAYDAAYIALAEAMNATLYTSDENLAKGHRAHVKLFVKQ